jgi:hypothetical protein
MRKLTALSLLVLLTGCGVPDDGPDDLEAIPEGKEDNFRGSNSQEFSATATARVILEDTLKGATADARLARAKDLVSARLLQIGWFLNLWVSDKEDEDSNKTYGGFNAMARNASVKALKIEPVDELTYSFNFEATIAGPNDFMSRIGGQGQGDGSKLVELKMGKLSNETLMSGSWTGAYGVHSWDPSKVDADRLETLTLTVKPITRSSNAYLNYQALFADGKLEVGAQFGWDYNEGRQDLANARELYDDLLGIGFLSPVEKYEDLKLDSAPLTRTASVGGKTVDVSVKLVHPGMVDSPSADAVKLREALLDLLAGTEVILFNGHAGVSGRLLPADFRSASAGNIMPEEYPKLKLQPGYQLLLIEGCQTYARFTEGFQQNPLKRGPDGQLVNMDIVTTASYSWTSQGAETMEAILYPLIGRAADKPVKASTWDDVLRSLNAPPNNTTFFGVNGIDNDPHGHPFARLDLLGQTCTSNSACGGDGNLCLKTTRTGSSKVCGTVCLDDAGCPSSYRCSSISSAGAVYSKACIAR